MQCLAACPHPPACYVTWLQSPSVNCPARCPSSEAHTADLEPLEAESQRDGDWPGGTDHSSLCSAWVCSCDDRAKGFLRNRLPRNSHSVESVIFYVRLCNWNVTDERQYPITCSLVSWRAKRWTRAVETSPKFCSRCGQVPRTHDVGGYEGGARAGAELWNRAACWWPWAGG